jgi:single-strand DNA-binding protein
MFEITGTIHHIGETEFKGQSQFPIRLFVLKNEGNYTDYFPFELGGEKTTMADGFQPGQVVTVNFNVRGREWNGRWFTSLAPFKIEMAGGSDGPPPPPPPAYDEGPGEDDIF